AANPTTAALFTLTPETGYGTWVWLIVLSMLAVLLLPRQWQVAVGGDGGGRPVGRGRWPFPVDLFVINLFALPLPLPGLLRFRPGSVDPDTFVLALPMAQRQPLLALVVFIGGLSAATAMIIVETVALATMVSNSLILPGLLRGGARYLGRRGVGGIALA